MVRLRHYSNGGLKNHLSFPKFKRSLSTQEKLKVFRFNQNERKNENFNRCVFSILSSEVLPHDHEFLPEAVDHRKRNGVIDTRQRQTLSVTCKT